MLEWLMVPALIGVAALVPSGNQDKGKIKTIFENVGYGIKKKDGKLDKPRFRKKLSIMDGEEQIGTRYLYQIPLGLPATKLAEMEKNVGIFTDGLNRPVIVEFKASIEKDLRKYLTISVFNKDIPNLYPYAKVPSISDKWVIPLGRTLEETIWHNFDHTPHMTVAGTTRFGKTVFLKVLITYLIEQHGVDVEFYIIDLKGGLEFGKYDCLKQVKAVANNPEEAQALLFYLTNSDEGDEKKPLPLGLMQEEYRVFRSKGWSNIVNTPLKKRRFVIVDEAAQLAPEKWMKPQLKAQLGFCQYALGEIARIGGALGYRLVFATQYPTADTLPRQIKQNADGKITFRLPSSYASDVAIDESGAEKLPSNIKGRGLYKTHELKEMQVPLIEDDEMWERLAMHQVKRGEIGSEQVNEHGTKEETRGRNFVEFIDDEVCDQGAAPKASQSRLRKKRTKNPKPNEGVSPHSESRWEERLLPKRKRKGVSRNIDRDQMEPPGGTPPVEE
ncbi:MAG: ftsK [Bacillales bacterium]|nr:ftsK [Bacillales bacterium]